MDPEEIRMWKLIRAGREKIIKYGTYDLEKARNIWVQDHPFYIAPEEPQEETVAVNTADAGPVGEDDLAASIISNNFKVGLSQAEVDAILAGMA